MSKVEWKKIEELGPYFGGLTGKTKEDFVDGNAKFITYMNVFANASLDITSTGVVRISDGEKQNAWVRYTLSRRAAISDIALKLTGWRQKCYPLEVYAGKKRVWQGVTPASLGYVHLSIDKPVAANDITIRMVAPVQNSTKFGQVKELAGGIANELDRVRSDKGKVELRIVEVDLLEHIAGK